MSDKLPKNLFRVGSKLYGICTQCDSVVRIDKPIIGSLHFCSNPLQKTENQDGEEENQKEES